MDNEQLKLSLMLVTGIGFAAMMGIIYFGIYVFQRFFQEFWENIVLMDIKNIKPNLPRYIVESYGEYLQRRNEFWTTYSQTLIAALIIIVLTILLITKTISAEAGLPILSAVSGFAIAKGVSAGRGGTSVVAPDKTE